MGVNCPSPSPSPPCSYLHLICKGPPRGDGLNTLPDGPSTGTGSKNGHVSGAESSLRTMQWTGPKVQAGDLHCAPCRPPPPRSAWGSGLGASSRAKREREGPELRPGFSCAPHSPRNMGARRVESGLETMGCRFLARVNLQVFITNDSKGISITIQHVSSVRRLSQPNRKKHPFIANKCNFPQASNAQRLFPLPSPHRLDAGDLCLPGISLRPFAPWLEWRGGGVLGLPLCSKAS